MITMDIELTVIKSSVQDDILDALQHALNVLNPDCGPDSRPALRLRLHGDWITAEIYLEMERILAPYGVKVEFGAGGSMIRISFP